MAHLARSVRLPLRTASASASAPALASAWRPVVACQMPAHLRLSPSPLRQAGVRYKSGPYGYVQAKALVFSKEGDPADVLR